MRFAISLVLLPCALMAQTSPPRPAGTNTLQNLERRLDWFQASGQPQQGEWQALPPTPLRLAAPVTVVAAAQPPKACAIPLLRMEAPKDFSDRMPVQPVPAGSIDHMPILAAPVCEEWGR